MTWQDEFEIKSELLQGDFEALEDALFSMPRALLLRRTDSAINHGAMLRAGIDAGWIISGDCEVLKSDKGEKRWFYGGKEVSQLHPSIVSHFGNLIDQRYQEIKAEVPKNL